MAFKGKVAAITGAGSGIGRALAVQLAKEGCDLALADLDEQGLAETARLTLEKGGRCQQTKLDVSDRQAVEQWSDDVVAEFGRVDYIFNNAGVALFDSADSLDYENFEWLMNINFWGMVYGTKAFLRYFKKAQSGHVINVSSIFGLIGYPGQSAYNASKFAIRGYTEALALELEGSNIHASSVHPGGIKTDIARNSRLRTDQTSEKVKNKIVKEFDKMAITTADQAADIILKGVRARRRKILIGRDARMIDIVQRLLPQSYGKWASKILS